MGLFNKKPMGGGFMDVIRCDEPSYLVWKWHPEGAQEGNNRKENAIRWGSSLRVKDGSVAVFVYNQQNGIYQDYIEGPCDTILSTNNLPVISRLLGLAYGGDSLFQAEVYFINLANIIQVRFGVPYFDVFDPRFLDFAVPTAVRGTISFRITDYHEFIKLHRLETFSIDDFNLQVRDAICRYVKEVVSNAPSEYGIPVMQLERKIGQINSIVEEKIRGRFFNEFGVAVSSVDIGTIEMDKDSEGYRELKKVTKDIASAQIQSKSEVDIRAMRDNQKIDALERAGRTVMNIVEDGYARHKQTQSSNLAAFQTESQEHIGVAGAQGLGMMGSSYGNCGGSMNPGAMMAGMAIGSAIGQNVASNITTGMNVTPPSSQMAPPPIPGLLYHVAVNGQATGPFDKTALGEMVREGTLTKDSLVWTQGMSNWEKSGNVHDLSSLFIEMPIIPNT